MTRLLGMLTTLVYGIVALVLLASVVLYVIPIGDIHLSYAALLRSFTTVKVVSLGVVIALLYSLRGRLLGEIAKTAVGKLAISIICAVTAISCFVYDTIAWQLSPKSWVNTPEFNAAVRPELRSKMYSYGSESYGASFYLGKPFSRVAPGSVQEGMVVFLEAKRLEEFKLSITPNIRELFRYRSGVESTRKDIVVIELTSPQIQSAAS